MTTRKMIPPPKDFPLFGWTLEAIKRHFQAHPLSIGDPVIIYNGQAGLFEYVLAQVVNPEHGRQRRVVLDKAAAFGGTSFYRNGKNCFSPTGQSLMLPPIKELMTHFESAEIVYLDHTAASIAALRRSAS